MTNNIFPPSSLPKPKTFGWWMKKVALAILVALAVLALISQVGCVSASQRQLTEMSAYGPITVDSVFRNADGTYTRMQVTKSDMQAELELKKLYIQALRDAKVAAANAIAAQYRTQFGTYAATAAGVRTVYEPRVGGAGNNTCYGCAPIGGHH